MENEIQNQNQLQPESAGIFGILKNWKILLAAGIILLLIILSVVFVTLAPKKTQQNNTAIAPSPTINLTTPEAKVYFEPEVFNITPGKKTSVNIFIDTMGREISGANIAVKYNPNVISGVTLTQFKENKSALSYALKEIPTAEPVSGTVELALQMDDTTPMQKGKGQVAVLSFTPKASNITMTEISFSPATALITRNPEKVIVLSKPTLRLNYP